MLACWSRAALGDRTGLPPTLVQVEVGNKAMGLPD